MKEQVKLKRGISPKELDAMVIPTLDFTGEWYEAFAKPEMTGVWFVWGNSGNGKTTFVAQLTKYLTTFARTAYNSMEEGASQAMQNEWRRINMSSVSGKIILLKESIDELCIRLDRKKAPRIVIVDSAQYTGLRVKQFYELAERYEKKVLFIFIAHADGKEPQGALAKKIMYHACLKIWVEGYRAFSKGRSIGPRGHYIIWPEKAAEYWGDDINNEK